MNALNSCGLGYHRRLNSSAVFWSFWLLRWNFIICCFPHFRFPWLTGFSAGFCCCPDQGMQFDVLDLICNALFSFFFNCRSMNVVNTCNPCLSLTNLKLDVVNSCGLGYCLRFGSCKFFWLFRWLRWTLMSSVVSLPDLVDRFFRWLLLLPWMPSDLNEILGTLIDKWASEPVSVLLESVAMLLVFNKNRATGCLKPFFLYPRILLLGVDTRAMSPKKLSAAARLGLVASCLFILWPLSQSF